MTIKIANLDSHVWTRDTLIRGYEIGSYQIVEFWSHPADNSKERRRAKQFGVNINGKRAGRVYSSLDEALLGCVAIKYDGINTQADSLFAKAIGADAEETFEEL